MSGAIPSLPSTPLWRGAQLKKSTGIALPLPLHNFLLLGNTACSYYPIRKELY